MHTLIPAFGWQLCEFEASLFYTAISRTDRIAKRDPVSKKRSPQQSSSLKQTISRQCLGQGRHSGLHL